MFGFMLRKMGRQQTSPLCGVRSLQDCVFSLVPAWMVQQHEMILVRNRGCEEGIETSSPGETAWDNSSLLLGKTLFLHRWPFLRDKSPRILSVTIVSDYQCSTQPGNAVLFVVLDHKSATGILSESLFQFSRS